MSKYTTQVRYICEYYSTNKNEKNIDKIIDGTWNKIFTTNVEFFDEEYRKILCCKIIKHYYMYEIGCETVALWLLWMNTTLEEIMPYYNQLYKSQLYDFNPFINTDITINFLSNKNSNEIYDRTTNITGGINETKTEENNTNESTETNENNTGEGTSKENTIHNEERTTNNTATKEDAYSDTPQGSLNNIKNLSYLTNARIINTNNNEEESSSGNINGGSDTSYSSEQRKTENLNKSVDNSYNKQTNKTDNLIENKNINKDDEIENIQTEKGLKGGKTYAELITEFRKTFLNIDLMIIKEFEENFMLLW